MKREQYIEQLDLTPEELSLEILDCSQKQILNQMKNIKSIDPKQLPALPFKDQSFDLALCTQVLFVDSELTENNHLDAILELARVATEVRIYPVTDNAGRPSVHLGPVIQALQLKGLGVELRQVNVQNDNITENNSNALLRLWQESCVLKNPKSSIAAGQ